MPLQRCYFDYNATTPLTKAAKTALISALDVYGNPSSVHVEGSKAKSLLQKSRRLVAKRLNANPDHVVFTSGASEAAMTLLTQDYKMGRAKIKFSHAYIGKTEHPCILEGGRFDKNAITFLDVDENGLLKIDALNQALESHDKKTGLPLVAVQAANGETGVIQNTKEIAGIVNQYGGVLLVDLVQYIGKFPVDINEFGGDFFIIAAHKIGGPKGVGAFVSVGSVLMPKPLIVAGGQEKSMRGGTEALPLIASFAAAMVEEPSQEQIDHAKNLQTHLETSLKRICKNVTIYGDKVTRMPNTTFFSVKGLKAETLQIGLDLAGFAVSSGTACSSGKVKQSSVLTAMGYNVAEGGIRVSTGADHRKADIDAFLTAFEKIILKAKK